MQLTLKVWRQKNNKAEGKFEFHKIQAEEHMSFLEMLDVLNEKIVSEKKEPVAFEHDCREGICGSCSMVINGRPHGPQAGTTTCQLHMRAYKSGDTITIPNPMHNPITINSFDDYFPHNFNNSINQ